MKVSFLDMEGWSGGGAGAPSFSWQRRKLPHYKGTNARWGSSLCESGINSRKHWEKKNQNTSLVRNNCSMVQCVNPATSVDGGKVLRKVKEPSMTFQPYKVQLSGRGWRDRRKKRIVFLVIGQAWRSSAGKGSSFRCTSPPHLYDGWIPQRYSLLTFSLRLQSSELWYNSQQRLQPKTSISNVMICMKWSARTLLCARHTSAPSRIYSQVCLVLIFTLKYHSFVYSPKKDHYLQQIIVSWKKPPKTNKQTLTRPRCWAGSWH